ncbi:MAG: hypothetical protein U5L04_05035 [Trueperaceae bacterium]|nr:hypothetical protein [Trueperaceae bacterium]
MPQANTLPAWQALQDHYQDVADLHMRTLFADDPHRFETYSLSLGDILFDYSKNRVTHQTMTLLRQLASEAGVTRDDRGDV